MKRGSKVQLSLRVPRAEQAERNGPEGASSSRSQLHFFARAGAAMFDRTFPPTFRAAPLRATSRDIPLPSLVPLRVRCQCGTLSFSASVAATAVPLRCSCLQCRKFSASSFATMVTLPNAPEPLLQPADRGGPVQFESQCSGLNTTLSRRFCKQCRSVLGGQTAAGEFLLALGCIEDESMPPALALAWRSNFRALATEQLPAWWTARPIGRRPTAPPRVLRGRCACGSCAFEAASGDEFQTQHCYCGLCRRLSGSVGETWVRTRDGPDPCAHPTSLTRARLRVAS